MARLLQAHCRALTPDPHPSTPPPPQQHHSNHQSCASSIHSCQSLPVLLRVVEGRLARTTDADALLSAAFKGVGRFGSAHVEAVRGRVQLVVQRQISAARARLAVLVGQNPQPPPRMA